MDIKLYQKIEAFQQDAQHLVTETYIKNHQIHEGLQSVEDRRTDLKIERVFIQRLLHAYARGCNNLQDFLNSYLKEINADNLTQIEMKEIFEQSREAQREMDKVFQDAQNQSAQTAASC